MAISEMTISLLKSAAKVQFFFEMCKKNSRFQPFLCKNMPKQPFPAHNCASLFSYNSSTFAADFLVSIVLTRRELERQNFRSWHRVASVFTPTLLRVYSDNPFIKHLKLGDYEKNKIKGRRTMAESLSSSRPHGRGISPSKKRPSSHRKTPPAAAKPWKLTCGRFAVMSTMHSIRNSGSAKLQGSAATRMTSSTATKPSAVGRHPTGCLFFVIVVWIIDNS